jgi:hypothetical protein
MWSPGSTDRPYEYSHNDGGAIYHASALWLDKAMPSILDEWILTTQSSSELLDAEGGFYRTALQVASVRGHTAVVRLLLEGGADVKKRVNSGHYGCALQAASFKGFEPTVRLLLASGAAINKESGDYGTALGAASASGHEAVVRLLSDHRLMLRQKWLESGLL